MTDDPDPPATPRDPDAAAAPKPGAPGGPQQGPSTATLGQLGQKIADLSRDLADLTRLAGQQMAPRQMETEAANTALRALLTAYANAPNALQEAQLDLFNRQSAALQQLAMGAPTPDAEADSRFADPAWGENPFFDFMRRLYLATAAWAENLAWNAPGLPDRDRRRAAFFIRQAMSSAAPSNLLMANPRALKAMFDTSGESVRRGLAHLQSDLDAGGGRLSVTQTDPTAFELGVTLATTPGDVVLRNSLIELIRYAAVTPTVSAAPLLIFPPWINKYYVLDLTRQNSMVAWLRDQGFTVYMVSWRSADEETRNFGWDDYVRLGGRAALDFVSAQHRTPVNVAGYCVGGALASALAARLAEDGDHRINSLTLMAAQTDFSDPGDLGLFMDEDALPGVARLIEDSGGVMPGEAMRDAFNLLRPEDLIWRYVEERYLLGENPRAFDLLYWNADQTNLPGPLHLESLRRLYIENALATGSFLVDGRPVNLANVTAPVFLHAARKDHISPFASVHKGVKLFGGDVTFLLADSGHIAGVVNPPAANRYRYWTRPDHAETPEGWLAGADETPGSWWPVWVGWLKSRSGDQVAPPRSVAGAPAAPGAYVRETLSSIREKRGA